MVLVDEAHDLSPAWKQLLATHAPGVVSLGDPHQRLSGRVQRWSSAKTLEMHQSVRQGRQVDALVNQSLALDDLGEPAPFVGASDRATGLRRYDDWSAVPSSGARLYGSLWRMLLEANELVARGARVHLHPASRQALLKEVDGPIDAWRSAAAGGPGQRWESFVQVCAKRGQADIPALFAAGFDVRRCSACSGNWSMRTRPASYCAWPSTPRTCSSPPCPWRRAASTAAMMRARCTARCARPTWRSPVPSNSCGCRGMRWSSCS